MTELHRPRIAILASSSGSTAEAFIHATQDGRSDTEVGLVISNNTPKVAKIHERVARLNDQYGLDIEMVKINGVTHPDPGGNPERGQSFAESAAIAERIRQGRFDLVMLLGYMKMVRGDLLAETMINSHPGPLPETADTFGLDTSIKALRLWREGKITATRHTVHIVSAEIDQGHIIAQHPVEILDDDIAQDVFNRVQAVEKATLPYVVEKFLGEQEASGHANS